MRVFSCNTTAVSPLSPRLRQRAISLSSGSEPGPEKACHLYVSSVFWACPQPRRLKSRPPDAVHACGCGSLSCQ